MHTKRFDSLTRRLAAGVGSRRRLLAFGTGLGLLGFSQLPDVTEASCRKNGRKCGPSGNKSCCSGTCKRGKCRPTRGAMGCTVRNDLCKLNEDPCPKNPNGLCFTLETGKPICAEVSICSRCLSHSDCVAEPNGKCIKNCRFCTSGDSICIYPKEEV